MKTAFIFIVAILLCCTAEAQNEPKFHYHYDKEKKEITLTIQNDTPHIMSLYHSRGDVTRGTCILIGTTKDEVEESYPYSLYPYKDGEYLPFRGIHLIKANETLTLKLRVGELEQKRFAVANKLFFKLKVTYGFLGDKSNGELQRLRYRFNSDNKEF